MGRCVYINIYIYIHTSALCSVAANNGGPKLFFTLRIQVHRESYIVMYKNYIRVYVRIIIINECVSFVLQTFMPFYETSIFYYVPDTMAVLFRTYVRGALSTIGFHHAFRRCTADGGVARKKFPRSTPDGYGMCGGTVYSNYFKTVVRSRTLRQFETSAPTPRRRRQVFIFSQFTKTVFLVYTVKTDDFLNRYKL